MENKNRVSLVVLAAGMGSRYGGLKQMDAFGPNGETIIDYSLYDAYRAGFNHVVFVIRDFFADKFKAAFDPKLEGRMDVDYVNQELTNIPNPSFKIPPERERPWGTGHAVWVAHPYINGPFGVINADDYYGPDSYYTLHNFLTTPRDPEEYGVVAYRLDNTLSEHGTVNRGVCKADDFGHLQNVIECKQIGKNGEGVISYTDDEGKLVFLSKDTPVSMNMWGLYPSYFSYFAYQFDEFLKEHASDPKAEFYIPTLIDNLIKSGERNTKLLHSESEWFGVTYKEDKDFVSSRLKDLLEDGVYPYKLWE